MTAVCFNVQHPIVLYAQPTGMTCWSAATTMLFGSTFCAGPGQAELAANGGLKSAPQNVERFAQSYNLRLYYPQCWSVEGFVNLLQRGPVAMIGALPSLHAVVVGGVSGDGTPSGTILKIYDPWPPNLGAVYEVTYQELLDRFPMATMYLLQR